MNEEEIQSALHAMNVDQHDIFEHVTQSVQKQMNSSTTDRLRLFITGNAETGKSFTFVKKSSQSMLLKTS